MLASERSVPPNQMGRRRSEEEFLPQLREMEAEGGGLQFEGFIADIEACARSK